MVGKRPGAAAFAQPLPRYVVPTKSSQMLRVSRMLLIGSNFFRRGSASGGSPSPLTEGRSRLTSRMSERLFAAGFTDCRALGKPAAARNKSHDQ